MQHFVIIRQIIDYIMRSKNAACLSPVNSMFVFI